MCASPEEIDDYIKDVVIGTWAQEKQIDYSKHAQEPTFWTIS